MVAGKQIEEYIYGSKNEQMQKYNSELGDGKQRNINAKALLLRK